MSLYPVSNFNIGTGVSTEVLDSISSADGTLVVTFSNGVATFTNAITGTILYAINIKITSDNISFGSFPVCYVKSNSGYQPVYVADSKIYINPSVGTLYADTIQATNQIVIGASGDYWSATGIHLANNSVDGVSILTLLDASNISNYWNVYSFTSRMFFDYNGVNKMFLSNAGLLALFGTLAGLSLESRDLGATDDWAISVSGANGATIWSLSSTTLANIMTLTTQGLQTLNGTSAGLNLTNQGSTGGISLYSIGNTLYVKGQASATEAMRISNVGFMEIIGTSAQVKIYSQSTSTTGDTYSMYSTGNAGLAYLRWNYYNASTATSAVALELSSQGLLTIGTSAGTAVGLRLNDRSTANNWTIYSSADVLTSVYLGAMKFQCSPTGQFEIDGSLASLVLNDRTSANQWAIYSNTDTLNFYFGADNLVRVFNTTISAFGTGTTSFTAPVLRCCNSSGYGVLNLFNTTAKVGLYYTASPDRLYACNTGVAGTTACYISANATSWTATSDRRVKNTIIPLGPSLDKILKLNPVSYKWNDIENDNTDYGLIAQEVFEILPEVVDKPENPETDYYGITYTALIPFLIKSIQELTERVSQLEKLNNF